MRVHRLEMTAFGPFSDTQVVDFDPLNAAGVFLLTGHTGAGKTSILDAICFGLFGQVPGVRDKAKSYRSHHAGPDVAPRVVLDLTLAGRRLRLTRHPAWSRPSRRAKSGRVDEKARATAEELVEGVWVARSTRADEVGHFVSGLLGLNRDQFCQVVMLPQGDFQAFLRAGARERQHILETLFGTQRFQAVERWLVDHRRLQARRCREHEEQVVRLVARVHEACSPATPGLRLGPDELAVDGPDLRLLVRKAVDCAGAELRQVRDHTTRTATLAKQARHALDEACTLAERRERHREARRRHTALLAMPEATADREDRLRRARAAAALQPLVVIEQECQQAHEAAEAAVASALRPCARIPGLHLCDRPAAATVARALDLLVRRLSRLDSLEELARECDELAGRIAAEVEGRLGIVASMRQLQAGLARAPGRVAELRAELEQVAATVRRGLGANQRQRQATVALAAADEIVGLDKAAAGLSTRLLLARESAAEAAEAWLQAREHRLAGMATELAGMLTDGDPCPVCGSVSHPAPAMPAGPQVSSDQETELLRTVDHLRENLARLEAERAEILAARSDALVRSGGLDVESATAQLDRAVDEAREAKLAATDQAGLAAELDNLERAVASQRQVLDAAGHEVACADARIAAWRDRLDSQHERLADEIGGADALPDAVAATSDQATHIRALESTLRARDETRRARRQAERRLAVALEPSELDSVADVVAAYLSPAEIAAEEGLARNHDFELSTWSRVLADPVLVAAAGEAAPDLVALETRAETAESAAAAATDLASAVERRQARLEDLLDELDVVLDALVPLREARELADEVAGLCAGSSTDNATRTALSHYVLAARLSQVVAAANGRLDAIGGGRYQLEHTMVRGAGDTRGGLGLLVRDTHTDQGRDPATLSGGETFYVSLSLALGLADVVTAEAGGAELSTLFVDEGFGSLDDDTRDEVLDELDALRSGGRSVGLVSHLSELRARCPVQLHVVATPRGSRCLPARGT